MSQSLLRVSRRQATNIEDYTILQCRIFKSTQILIYSNLTTVTFVNRSNRLLEASSQFSRTGLKGRGEWRRWSRCRPPLIKTSAKKGKYTLNKTLSETIDFQSSKEISLSNIYKDNLNFSSNKTCNILLIYTIFENIKPHIPRCIFTVSQSRSLLMRKPYAL